MLKLMLKLIPNPITAKRARTGSVLLTASVLCGSLTGLAGCGGGGTTAAAKSAKTAGRFALTVKWPTPSRLIPTASNSIDAVLTSGGTTLAHKLLVKPTEAPWTTTVTFDNLTPGAVTLTAKAYPTADGSGTAQATGAAGATITAGAQSSVTISMASTIDHLAITPASPTINVGDQLQFTETALDAQGNIVLTAPQNILWATSNSFTAQMHSGTGLSFGVHLGNSTITVTDKETGKTGTTILTVNDPQAAPAKTPSRAVTDLTGKFLYVADYASQGISQFRINADGTLSPLTPAVVAVGKIPYSLAVNPKSGTHALYVGADDQHGGALYQYNINADGTLTPLLPTSVFGSVVPFNTVIDPAGKYMYEVDLHNGIRCFAIAADGTVTQNGPDFRGEIFDYYGTAIAPDGKMLYVGAGQNQGIRLDRINGDGTLTNVGSVPDFANDMTIDPSGPYLIVDSPSGINTYLIGADDTITKIGAGAANASGTARSAITPDSKHLYVVGGLVSDTISQYSINTDGSLTALAPLTIVPGKQPLDIVVTRDGKFAYVVNATDDTISQYRINSDGTLTPLTPGSVPG